MRLKFWKRQEKDLSKMSDYELFECYKKCNPKCFGFLYEKHHGHISSILEIVFKNQFVFDFKDFIQDKTIGFIEKNKPEKKDLNKEGNKNIKSFLTKSYINHGINFLDLKGNKVLYLNAQRDKIIENDKIEFDTDPKMSCEKLLEKIELHLSLNKTQNELLLFYCRASKKDTSADIAKKMNRSKSYVENVLTQIRKKAKQSGNEVLIRKIINREL